MNGQSLSWQERKILEEIETDLRADRQLDSELSGMRLRRHRRAAFALLGRGPRGRPASDRGQEPREPGHGPLPGRLVLLLACCSIGLFCLAVEVRTAAVLALLVLVWVVALTVLIHRRARPGAARPPGERQ